MLILVGWARGWDWTRHEKFRWLHLGSILFVAISTWLDMYCPLTILESYLREQAGSHGYEIGFIGYWLDRLLFYTAPAWVFTFVYTLFALVVVLTFIAYPPKKQAKYDS
jgi:hypothetical protein